MSVRTVGTKSGFLVLEFHWIFRHHFCSFFKLKLYRAGAVQLRARIEQSVPFLSEISTKYSNKQLATGNEKPEWYYPLVAQWYNQPVHKKSLLGVTRQFLVSWSRLLAPRVSLLAAPVSTHHGFTMTLVLPATGMRAAVLSRRVLSLRSPAWRPAARAFSLQRPVSALDVEACRRVLTGKNIRAADNPGIRLESRFVSQDFANELETELRGLEKEWGFSTAGHGLDIVTLDGGSRIKEPGGTSSLKQYGEFTSMRITGREEGQERAAPWGYGDQFDEGKLPGGITKLVSDIRKLSDTGYKLESVRDVTINYRGNSFFRLDPHVDPSDDGPTVFILGLLSDVVLTFVPPDVERRQDPVEVGQNSWTDKDIDVLVRFPAPLRILFLGRLFVTQRVLPSQVQQRSLLSFSGAARDVWAHAIRGGMEVTEVDGRNSVVDFWGKPDFLLRRNKERISVVVAFS